MNTPPKNETLPTLSDAGIDKNLAKLAPWKSRHAASGSSRRGGLGQLIELQRIAVGLARPGRPKKIGVSDTPISTLPSLSAAGIDKNLAHLARKFFGLDDSEFDDHRRTSPILRWPRHGPREARGCR